MTIYWYTALDDPMGNFTEANGINDNGQIVGYYQDSSGGGFLYSGGSYTTLTDPLAPNATYARGINDAGQIVGFYLGPSSTFWARARRCSSLSKEGCGLEPCHP
jgi:probable HAF family extracellular repeat protein